MPRPHWRNPHPGGQDRRLQLGARSSWRHEVCFRLPGGRGRHAQLIGSRGATSRLTGLLTVLESGLLQLSAIAGTNAPISSGMVADRASAVDPARQQAKGYPAFQPS